MLYRPSLVWCVLIFFNSIQARNIHLVVHSRIGAGFFAEMRTLLDRIAYYEHENLEKVSVEWTQEFFPYKDNPHENGWNLYFEPIEIKRINNEPLIEEHHDAGGHELHDQKCQNFWLYNDVHIPYREWVHNKIKKYIKIKPHILDTVERFYKEHLAGYTCIGVHARYSNFHDREVPGGRVPTLEEYYVEVDRLIEQLGRDKVKVFVASDSHVAVRAFKERYGDILVYINAFRAPNREDPHLIGIDTGYWMNHPEEFHEKKPGYKGGLETLMDCLLLSRCDYLFMTMSNLAKFACFFNPKIKAALLPRSIQPWVCQYKENRVLRAKVRNQWHLDLS